MRLGVFCYYKHMIVGIDEVGRGCWAGPLVAGAVVLHQDLDGLRDSKQLQPQKREAMAQHIHETGHVSLGWVTPSELDACGLTGAVRLAMQRALDGLDPCLYEEIIIDGSYNFLDGYSTVPTRAIVRADGSIPAVSASSIVAKVARDDFMQRLDPRYAGYGFETHVGYGTAKHRQALQQLGVSDIHRRSFRPIQQLLEVTDAR